MRTLHNVIRHKAAIVFTVGVAPAMTYGAAVHGLRDTHVLALRRVAATAFSPTARNASLTMKLLLNHDPTDVFELAPAIQYSRMTWWAKTEPSDAARRHADITDIRNWFEEAAKDVKPLAQQVLQNARESGPLGGNGSNAAWRRIRGPPGALMLTLARIGWGAVGPFSWVDDRGVTINITAQTPAAIGALLRDGHRRSLERRLGHKWAATDSRYKDGRSVCADLAEKYITGKCPPNVTLQQRGAYRSCVANALMTNSRAKQGGYAVEDRCPLCGCEGDSVYHRVYHCKCTAPILAACCPSGS